MTPSPFETIRYEKTGAIATLTKSRPERMNGMTNRMLCEATEALAAAAEDRELRVLVLTGAGRSFCPGADLNVVASGEGPLRGAAPRPFPRAGSSPPNAGRHHRRGERSLRGRRARVGVRL